MVRFSKIGIGGLWIDSKTVVFAYDVRFDLYLGKVSWLFGFDMGLDFGRVEINEGCLEKVRSDNIRHFSSISRMCIGLLKWFVERKAVKDS